MYRVQGITAFPKQKQTVILPNGNKAQLYLEYSDQQLGWFLDLTYGSFQLKSKRIVNVPNILHQFSNILPFGIGCFQDDGQDPTLLQDFSSGRSKLYILDQSEVLEFERYLNGDL